MKTALGLLGIALVIGLYLLALAHTGVEIDGYDDEEDQW